MQRAALLEVRNTMIRVAHGSTSHVPQSIDPATVCFMGLMGTVLEVGMSYGLCATAVHGERGAGRTFFSKPSTRHAC